MRSRFEADVLRNSGDTVDSLAHVSDCSLVPSESAHLPLLLSWRYVGSSLLGRVQAVSSASSARSSNQTLGGHDSHTAIASGSRVPGLNFFAEGDLPRICARIGCATAVVERSDVWTCSGRPRAGLPGHGANRCRSLVAARGSCQKPTSQIEPPDQHHACDIMLAGEVVICTLSVL